MLRYAWSAQAARLLEARDAGATDIELQQATANALGEVCFRDYGRRAQELPVDLTDITLLRGHVHRHGDVAGRAARTVPCAGAHQLAVVTPAVPPRANGLCPAC
ncbi:hypothetical protein ACIGO8_30825 [Streptomyces sp. NPDC053493]|uniref:hypothetical protein n=1 Tax=Streptomyces sp. NPDC053493 TaxID=3365705 RepID=UPI0037D1B7D8